MIVALALVLRAPLLAGQLDEDPDAVTLPLDLEINGSKAGETIVRSTPTLDVVEIEGSQLKELLVDQVAEELVSLIQGLPDGFASLEQLREHGLEIKLNLERLVIAISIQEKTDPASQLPSRISFGLQRKLNHNAHIDESSLSGYANLRWRSARQGSDNDPTRNSHSLGISHVLNIHGYAIEGESVWNEADGFRTRDLRIVRDLPEKLWRISLGDVSTPIIDLQRGFRVFGLNLAKEFGIQPYRSFTPTGSANIALQESATVRVRLNGRTIRTLRLEEGDYDLEEFKLVAGENNMELEIEGDSGLVDTLNITEFGSMELLDKGVSTYSLTFGWPRTSSLQQGSAKISDFSWYERFVADKPVFSGYYRKGINKRLTRSFDFQASEMWHRLGGSIVAVSPEMGSLNAQLSLNQSKDNPSGYSLRTSWRNTVHGYNLTIDNTLASNGYNLTEPGAIPSDRDLASSSSISISKLLENGTNVSLGALFQKSQNGQRTSSTNLSFGKRFGSVYANTVLRYRNLASHDEFGGFISFTWSPTRKWRNRSQIRYNNSQKGLEFQSRFNYANRWRDSYVSASLDPKYNDQGFTLDGGLAYQTSLYSASLLHTEFYTDIGQFVNKGTDSSLNLSTALAFADGSFGFASQIRDSFAIVSQHKAWKDVTLGINPTIGGYEKMAKPTILKPVLSNMPSYREGYAMVQSVQSERFLDRNDFYFFPGYRRGTKVVIGSDAIYNVRSALTYSDGEPVVFKALLFRKKDQPTITGFTNRIGRFVVTGLTPGPYTIHVADSDETAELLVEEGETMILIDSIQLE